MSRVPLPSPASQFEALQPLRTSVAINPIHHMTPNSLCVKCWLVKARSITHPLPFELPPLQPRTTWNVGMGIIRQYSVIPGHYHVPSWERDPVMCAAVCDWSGSSLSPPLTAILNTRLCSAFNINKRSRQAGGQAAVSYTHIHTHTLTHTQSDTHGLAGNQQPPSPWYDRVW